MSLVDRAVQRLHDNIARREATEDVEALKMVLIHYADLKSELAAARSALAEKERELEFLREQREGRSDER